MIYTVFHPTTGSPIMTLDGTPEEIHLLMGKLGKIEDLEDIRKKGKYKKRS